MGDRTGDVPVAAGVKVETLHVRPFRRAMTGFDVFFHAAGNGTIDGRPFTATHSGTGSALTFDDLPAELAGAWIGGPLAWLESARLDLEIRHSAPTGGGPHQFAFAVHLDGLRLAMPPDPPLRWRVATKPLRMWLDGRDPSLTLAFESRIEPAALAQVGRSPGKLFARLGRAALTDALAEKAGIAGDALGRIGEVVQTLRR